jgi:hypothetical protein
MKASELKKLIEESVRKVIQEELKEILIEAVKSPKQVIRESYSPPQNPFPTTPPPSTFTQPTMDVRQKYRDILGETAMSFTSNDVSMPFTPSSVDPVNGSLGHGELGLDQIMGLINNK